MQPDVIDQPKYPLGSLVLYGDACVRVIGIERYVPGVIWLYLLGAKVGKHKMAWHDKVAEIELRWPQQENVIDMTTWRRK